MIGVAAAAGLAGCGSGTPPPVAVDSTPGVSPPAAIQVGAVYQPGNPDTAERIRGMADSGARMMRVDLVWSQVARSRPANPTDPDDPVYRWDEYDRLVSLAAANGLEVMFTVWGTPAWAADPTVAAPAGIPATARRPADPADFGAFGAAAAARYAPRGVRRWEGWNEPNIAFFLYPQFVRGEGGRWTAVSPSTYAGLQRVFYENVTRVAPNALVAGAVTAPAGERRQSPPPTRVPPDDFIKELDAPGLRPPMDAVSHHPYPLSAPRDRTPPGRNYVDLYNLDVLKRAVDRTYLRGRPLWLTEYGFGTESVPGIYELAFTPEQQADHIADAFRRIGRDRRVELSSYYHFRDHAKWKSGLLDEAGVPKPGRAAFALPLALDAAGPVAPGTPVRLVGQARSATGRTTVAIDWRDGDEWRLLTQAATSRDGTFALTVRPAATLALRARWSGRGRSGAELDWTSPPVTVEVAPPPRA